MLKKNRYSDRQKNSDNEIIIGIKEGGFKGNKYIDNLYQCYLPLITHFVKTNRGTESEGKDIFQNGIIKFYKYVVKDIFRQECSIKTYLYTICRGLWLNELNRTSRKAVIDKDFLEYVDLKLDIETPLDILMKKEIKHQLRDLLITINKKCKEILSLYYYQKKSMKEIAIITSLKNENSVKTRKYKCIQMLKKQININPSLKKKFEDYLE